MALTHCVASPARQRTAAGDAAHTRGVPVAADAYTTQPGSPASDSTLLVGRRVFEENCRACHGTAGLGAPGLVPPLIASALVTGPPATLLRIVLDGLTGPIDVAGVRYAGDAEMPGWRDRLSDREIAALASYLRAWRPNDAPPVAAATVAAVRNATAERARPWTAAELTVAEREAP